MSLFRHPHLSQGIVHTPRGAFVVSRGLVEMPDDLGTSFGWRMVNPAADAGTEDVLTRPRDFPRHDRVSAAGGASGTNG